MCVYFSLQVDKLSHTSSFILSFLPSFLSFFLNIIFVSSNCFHPCFYTKKKTLLISSRKYGQGDSHRCSLAIITKSSTVYAHSYTHTRACAGAHTHTHACTHTDTDTHIQKYKENPKKIMLSRTSTKEVKIAILITTDKQAYRWHLDCSSRKHRSKSWDYFELHRQRTKREVHRQWVRNTHWRLLSWYSEKTTLCQIWVGAYFRLVWVGFYGITGTLAQRLECSPMARETWVQSQVESYQRL